jgi:hypothetical protein
VGLEWGHPLVADIPGRAGSPVSWLVGWWVGPVGEDEEDTVRELGPGKLVWEVLLLVC